MTLTPDAQAELDLLPVGVAHIDRTATVVALNRMMGEMIGLPPAALLGRNLFDFSVGEVERYAQMLDFGTGFTRTVMGPLAVRYRHADGSVRRSALWARNHLDDPEVGALALIFVPDAAESGVRSALTSIAGGEAVDTTLARLAEALEGSPFDARGCWLIRDDRGRRLAGDASFDDPIRAALSQPGRWWGALRSDTLLTCDDTRVGDEADRLLAAAGIAAWWVHPCRAGDDVEAAVIVLRDHEGGISPNQVEHLDQLVMTATLAFERASMEARLAHAAFHDPLTGLANRSLFFHRDERRVGRLGLLYIDLDRFKPVNDELGHTAGDLVLVTVSDRIRRAVRPTDRITRFGGDEFVVECPGVGTEAEVIDIAERIIAAVAEPIRLDQADVVIGASIGIALSDGTAPVDALLDRSDAALLAAKAAGKGRWHLAATEGESG